MSDDEPPLVEHDPNEFHVPFLIRIIPGVQMFVLVGIGFVALTYERWKPHLNDWRNIPFALLWLLLLAWCVVPRVPLVRGDGHEATRKSLAFRLGKKLNRIFHHRA